MTRRALVRRGILGTVLLLLGGSSASFLWPTRRRAARGSLRVFDEEEASILAAVAETVLRIEPGAPSAADVDVVGRLDAAMALASTEVSREFRRLLRLFENGLTGVLTGSGSTSFTASSERSRAARLRAWETSRISLFRTGFQAMKRLCAAGYYSSPETWLAIGFPGPPEILA